MVDPDWIHILGKQYLPCVKGKVTVYVMCQCSETRCFWRVIYHHISGSVLCSLLHSLNCLVYTLFLSKYTYHVSGLRRKIVLAVITHFLRDNKADRIKQTTLLKFVAVLETK